MTFTLGLWAIPLFITILAWGWAFTRPVETTSGFMPDISPIFHAAAALIVTLFAWMVYGLLT